MTPKLSPLLASYVESMNGNDSAAFIGNFAPDAVVHDEGHEYHGSAAIQAWIEEAHRKYQPKLEVTEVTETAGRAVITGRVSGSFDGSPLELHHHLTLADGKITALAITA